MRIPLPTHQFHEHESDAKVGASPTKISEAEWTRVREFLSKPNWDCPVCGCVNNYYNKGCPACLKYKNPNQTD